jgi:hypothetical protein
VIFPCSSIFTHTYVTFLWERYSWFSLHFCQTWYIDQKCYQTSVWEVCLRSIQWGIWQGTLRGFVVSRKQKTELVNSYVWKYVSLSTALYNEMKQRLKYQVKNPNWCAWFPRFHTCVSIKTLPEVCFDNRLLLWPAVGTTFQKNYKLLNETVESKKDKFSPSKMSNKHLPMFLLKNYLSLVRWSLKRWSTVHSRTLDSWLTRFFVGTCLRENI